MGIFFGDYWLRNQAIWRVITRETFSWILLKFIGLPTELVTLFSFSQSHLPQGMHRLQEQRGP